MAPASRFREATGFDRSRQSWRMKRYDIGLISNPEPLVPDPPQSVRSIAISDNSLEGEFNWREWNNWIKDGQKLRRKSKGSLADDEATITITTDENVHFIVLGDSHIGAWSTDHEFFERITDEILSYPNLYVALMGDMAHMAIKLRNVVEVGDNLLPADLQLLYLSSWLMEIRERILFASWGNHEVERPESQAGLNPFGDIYRKAARHYFNGIGHLTINVNGIPYRIAASHHFRGRSIYSPVHGAQRYLTFEASDRDIAIAGDSHVPGYLKFPHGRDMKVALNCGSAQTMSGYAQRYFSLVTHPIFPVVTLDCKEKDFWAHMNIREWQRAKV
jgi:hypothetical protein